MKVSRVMLWFAVMMCSGMLQLLSSETVVVLDQYNSAPQMNGGANLFSGKLVAQTWRVGVAGEIARVDFGLLRGRGTLVKPDAPILAEICDVTDDGLPAATVLATSLVEIETVPWDDFPARYTLIDFTASHLQVTPGQKLSLVLSTPSTGFYAVRGSGNYGNDGYPLGVGYSRYESSWQEPFEGIPRWDWDFRTYVAAVPEPNVLFLVLGSATGMVVLRFRGGSKGWPIP